MPPAAIWKKKKKVKKHSSNVHLTHTRVSSAALSIGKTELVATKIITILVIVYAITALDLEPWILGHSCRSSDATTASKEYILWSRQPIFARALTRTRCLFFCATHLPTEACTELLRCIPLLSRRGGISSERRWFLAFSIELRFHHVYLTNAIVSFLCNRDHSSLDPSCLIAWVPGHPGLSFCPVDWGTWQRSCYPGPTKC